MRKVVIIGSRGSELALAQAHQTQAQLRDLLPGVDVQLKIIATKGDKILDAPLSKIGGKGLFTKEIEVALLDGRIDLAVHSLKDLPTTNPPGLTVASVPFRENPRDALVSVKYACLDDLPQGATVGTSSLRRKAQLLASRPDLNIVDIRGNVATRVSKVADGSLDAAILACAGLERLGRKGDITQELSPDIMLSAPAQGALGLQVRADDHELIEALEGITDKNAIAEATAERALLAALGGGCQVPIGALARTEAGVLTLRGCVCHIDGSIKLEVSVRGPVADAETLGTDAARQLLAQGAQPIINEVMEAAGHGTKTLGGRRIVLTRPEEQGVALAQALRDRGADVFHFPTIAIENIDTVPIDTAQYDWIAFTSANAVRSFLKKNSISEDTQVAAVGSATRQALVSAGVNVAITSNTATAEALAQSLATIPDGIVGKRVLFPKANIAKNVFPDELRAAGAEVTELVVYNTTPTTPAPEALQALMDYVPDVVVFTSGSTATSFATIAGPENITLLAHHGCFASIGPVTTVEAQKIGIPIAITAEQHDTDGLVQALEQWNTQP